MSSAPVLASASGDNSYTGIFPGIVDSDGFHFEVKAPNPVVGPGVRVLTHTRAYLNRGAYQFNGIGYYTFDNQENRRLAYQISDSYGNYIYTLTSPVYQPYENDGGVSNLGALMYRTSGQWWRFQWFSSHYNVSIDAWNSVGGNTITEASLGPDGVGGCPSSYPVRAAWNWLWRNKYSGNWYTFPATSNYAWGNTPTWFISGTLKNGWAADFGTVSCP